MKHDATDGFVRDTICGCYGAERFFLLHHTISRPSASVQREYQISVVSALVVDVREEEGCFFELNSLPTQSIAPFDTVSQLDFVHFW